MKIFQGNSVRIDSSFMGRVDCIKSDVNGVSYLATGDRYSCLIRTGTPVLGNSISKCWYSFNSIDLEIGDIVSIGDNGLLQIVYSSSSPENSLFLTNRCNHNCIMCAQPHLGHGNIYYKESKIIVDFIECQPKSLGITGGEPLLYKDLFLDFFSHTTNKLPETFFQVLTNGSSLSSKIFAKSVCSINQKATFCIPIYGDNERDHDRIVGKNGAFFKTIQGIYNLADLNADIEIRIVLFSETIDRIANIAEFISKNFPFVHHVAIMGIEMMGKASSNSNFYINLKSFRNKLIETSNILISSNIFFSFFNIPLCEVSSELHKFCRQSISPWKIRFVNKCNSCVLKELCCGIFFSNIPFTN